MQISLFVYEEFFSDGVSDGSLFFCIALPCCHGHRRFGFFTPRVSWGFGREKLIMLCFGAYAKFRPWIRGWSFWKINNQWSFRNTFALIDEFDSITAGSKYSKLILKKYVKTLNILARLCFLIQLQIQKDFLKLDLTNLTKYVFPQFLM